MGEICEDFTPVGGAVAINNKIPQNILHSKDHNLRGVNRELQNSQAVI